LLRHCFSIEGTINLTEWTIKKPPAAAAGGSQRAAAVLLSTSDAPWQLWRGANRHEGCRKTQMPELENCNKKPVCVAPF
jgi:hypothetical protein